MEIISEPKSELRAVAASKWVQPACFVAAAVAALLFGFFLVSPEIADGLIRHLGYWILMGTVSLFVWSLWTVWREKPRRPWRMGRSSWLGLAVTVLGGSFLLMHEPFMFKVLGDEAVLAATSLQIHLTREILVSTAAHDLEGQFSLIHGYVDKRPYFFPFLVSLLHDFTGYRTANAFVLNGILAFLLVALSWIWGSRNGGNRGGGVMVLLLVGLPLLAINAASGGFDLLNLVMILACALLGALYLEKRSAPTMSAFCIGVVLLAQTRYESVLFVVGCGLLLALVWISERRMLVTWPVVLCPLLMLPYVWQNRVLRQNAEFWQLPEGLDAPFSVAYAGENFGHALNFLTDLSLIQPNSLWLTAIGGIGVIGSGVILACRRQLLGEPSRLSFAVFGTVILLNFFLLLCYHWGQIDDYVASRLALPLHLLFAMGAVHFLSVANVSRGTWNMVLGASCAFILGYTVPVKANQPSIRSYINGQEVEWAREFIQSNRHSRTLYVMGYTCAAIAERVPTISHSSARKYLRGDPAEPDYGNYPQILVTQRLTYDSVTGEATIDEDQDLGPSISLERLDERRFNQSSGVRISRILPSDHVASDSNPAWEGRGL